MSKPFELTERSKRVATLARLLGYKGDESKIKNVDIFLGTEFKLAPKSISQIRWKYKFSPENSAKILKMLGAKAQHFEGLSDFLSIDADGKVLPSLRKGQKSAKKKAAKKAAKPSKTRAPKATSAAPPATQKPVVSTTAEPAATPKAVVPPSESVVNVPATGSKIVITQVQHGGTLCNAILFPAGGTVSVYGLGTSTVITVE